MDCNLIFYKSYECKNMFEVVVEYKQVLENVIEEIEYKKFIVKMVNEKL